MRAARPALPGWLGGSGCAGLGGAESGREAQARGPPSFPAAGGSGKKSSFCCKYLPESFCLKKKIKMKISMVKVTDAASSLKKEMGKLVFARQIFQLRIAVVQPTCSALPGFRYSK